MLFDDPAVQLFTVTQMGRRSMKGSLRVKLRNTRNEQMFSALPPITDILGGRLARLSSGGTECFHSLSDIPRMPLGERPARA